MPKNITLSVSEEIGNEMEKMPEVNWSAVARACIQQYIEMRRNPDISVLLSELKRQRGEEYLEGRRKAEEIAKILGYRRLNLLLKKYGQKILEVEEMESAGGPQYGEYLPSPNEFIEQLLIEHGLIKEASDEFLKGMRERLLEIKEILVKEP